MRMVQIKELQQNEHIISRQFLTRINRNRNFAILRKILSGEDRVHKRSLQRNESEKDV